MSRIGKKPIALPDKVKVGVSGNLVSVEGPLGKLDWSFRREMTVTVDEDAKQVLVTRDTDDREARALHGLTRALIQNMINGVTAGFEKRLEIVGVGYIAVVQNGELQMRVGFANEIQKKIPAGLDVTCPDQTHIIVKGIDKQSVGQFAAEVRAVRKPEPYKGKGIRYEGEHVRRKAGKAVGA